MIDIEKLKESIARTENELIKKEIVDIKEYFLQEISKTRYSSKEHPR